MPRTVGRVVLAGLLAAIVGGCTAVGGGAYAVSVGDKTTLTYGWEDRFAIEWTADVETPQTRLVHGRVAAVSGGGADRMRLLVQASDGSGQALAQRLVWLPTGVPGGLGTYFEVSGMPLAAQYRVTVWDYTRIESVGDFR
jgi:hypothetical protein